VVYGAGKESASLAGRSAAGFAHPEIGERTQHDFRPGARQRSGEGDDRRLAVRAHQGTLLHVDLKRIAMDKKLTVTVPVVLKGEAIGIKTEGGILEQLLRAIEIECLPADIQRISKWTSATSCSVSKCA